MTAAAKSVSGIIREPELMEATGYDHRGHLERWLRNNHVPYFRGRGGALFTTQRLLESVHLPQSGTPAATPTDIEF